MPAPLPLPPPSLCAPADLGWVETALDAMGAELRRRMAAAGVQGGLPALQLLNTLLFGRGPSPRHPRFSSIPPPDPHGLEIVVRGYGGGQEPLAAAQQTPGSARLAALQASPCRAHLSFASPGGRAWPCRATGRLTLSPQIRCWITCCPIGKASQSLSPSCTPRWVGGHGLMGGQAVRYGERMLAGKLQPPLCSAPCCTARPPAACRSVPAQGWTYSCWACRCTW